MRIQHNIAAMNSYRNYFNNVSAVNKNLEKLSSGYKVNRAGDDAAGLAISEKMRAQITGLDAAQKNVKDGISLVKTAEGAMQEIQDMLNRMDYLATQSANGTYDNEVDRANLQKEVENLKTEINRIADSANFNGIKLLDGSLAAEGSSTTNGGVQVDLSKLGVDLLTSATNVSATKNKQATGGFFANEATAGQITVVKGDQVTMTIDYTDSEGVDHTKEVTFKIGQNSTNADAKGGIYLDDGSENGIYLADLANAGTLTKKDLADAAKIALEKDSAFKAEFDITAKDYASTPADGGLTFESRVPGENGAKINSLSLTATLKADATSATPKPRYTQVEVKTTSIAEDGLQAIDFTTASGKGMIFDLEADPNNTTDKLATDINEAIFEVNGEKFVFIQNGKENDVDFQKALRDAGVTHWVEVGTANTIAATDISKMVNKISEATGLKVEQGTTAVNTTTGAITWTKDANTGTSTATGTKVVFRANGGETVKKEGGGLMLQIGDTSDKFNQMRVNIGDMHTYAMGTGKTTLDGKEVNVTKTIKDIDISNQDGAAEAIGVIKNAINYVSSVRGDLGAVQNRLDHTANNLSVMEENIQDAESTIRDTDVAEEMMSYTKNNILVQSAQAMLAQANQIPQGVLQLLG